MFTDYICRMGKHFRDCVAGDRLCADTLDLLLRTGKSDLRRVYAERLLDVRSEVLMNAYHNSLVHSQLWAKVLKRILELEFSFLLYAVGVYVGCLLKQSVYRIPVGNLGAFTICFGGRGADIMRWISANGPMRIIDPLKRKLVEMFHAGVKSLNDFSAQPEFRISGKVKEEVARGLLEDLANPKGVRAVHISSVASLAPMDDGEYMKAFRNFIDAFNKVFHDEQFYKLSEIDNREMARLLDNVDDTKRDPVNAFMKSLYDGFIEREITKLLNVLS